MKGLNYVTAARRAMMRKVLNACKINAYSERARGLASLSSLAHTFNSYPGKSLNFNFIRKNTGLFGISCLNEPEGFHLMKSSATEKSDVLIAEALSSRRKQKMVEIFDHLSDSLCQVADLAEFIRIAHPTSSFAAAAEDASICISGLVEKLNTNLPLYRSLKDVTTNGDIVLTDAIDDHVADLFLFDFEQSGIHLSESKRKRVVQLNENILYYGSVFMNCSQQVKVVPHGSVNNNIRHLFPRDGNNLIVNGLFANCHSEEGREAAYKIYLSENKEQSDVLAKLLAFRHEMAILCGFPTYNHRAVKGSIAGSPEMVYDFLDTLSTSLKNSADDEFELMRELKRTKGSDKDLMPWDVPYMVSCLKYDRCKIDAACFSPYFSIGSCMEGLSNLFKCLYGISLEVHATEPGEVWYPDVQKLAVRHESEGTLGYIYCDFFERSSKPSHDCHFTIRGGKQLENGDYQLPIVVLMLNLPSPSLTVPSLLSPSMVENLFHEIGHAMHSMLARTKYQHITGTRCSTDFAEVPSVLMEFFASDPRVLSTFARHYKTGESMPPDMLMRLHDSKKLFTASEIQLQVFYSMLDQKLHSPKSSEISMRETLEDTQNQYYSLPYVPETAWHLTFGHLVGYGAKYYSYLMSKAVASWIWQANFEQDPFSREMGEKYRHEVLAHGGGKPPRDLVQDYLGKKVEPSNLVSSLINDLYKNKN